MKKLIKWFLISSGLIVVLLVAAIIIAPMLIDVQSYKPEIEKKVTEVTGRPVSLGGDMSFSLFPWVGFSFSGLEIGNPEGFTTNDFVKVNSFEARVKLLPLFSREIEVKQIILDGPEIYLTRQSNGSANWEVAGSSSQENIETKQAPAPQKKDDTSTSDAPGELPIVSLLVGELAITNGRLMYKDEINSLLKEITDLNFRLTDITLEKPIGISFSAMVDKQPISLNGSFGPIGKEPGKEIITIDFAIEALNQLAVKINGQLSNLLAEPAFDFELGIEPFSPKKLFKELKVKFPVETSDEAVLNKVALQLKINGNQENISLANGLLALDDSQLNFQATLREMSRPDVGFKLALDHINIDRYLPPPAEKNATSPSEGKPASEVKEQINYQPLRKLLLDGEINVDELIAQGMKINDFKMNVLAKDGIFTFDPVQLNLYEGSLSTVAILDVQKDMPVTKIKANAKEIQVGPLLRDAIKKDVLEGGVAAEINLSTQGIDPETIKKNLNGAGDLKFIDGAIVGIDIAGMSRDITSALTFSETSKVKPRTDFAELHVPFTLTNGLFNTPDTILKSPLLRLNASGDANLATEALDMKVKPKIVGTLKGQGDTAERSGIMVPIHIGGTFSKPEFSADTEALVKGIISPKENVLENLSNPEEAGKSLEEHGKQLLKGFGFGN